MSMLWALVALLSIHIGVLDSVSGQMLGVPGGSLLSMPDLSTPLQPTTSLKVLSGVPKLPISIPPVPNIPSITKKKPSKDPAERNELHCDASAWYFLSTMKINNYLIDAIPKIIEDLFNCAEFDVAGFIKTILESANFKSFLSAASLLSLGGGNPLSGFMGSMPLPMDGLASSDFLTSMTGNLPAQGPDVAKLTSLFGGAKNVLGQSGNPLEGKKSDDFLKSALGNIKTSEGRQGLDKSEDLVNTVKKTASSGANVLPGSDLGALVENSDKITDSLGNQKFHAHNIVIKNITTRTESSFIIVQAYVQADISGPENLIGSVVDVVGFRVQATVELKIALKTNGTKCATFEILETKMKVVSINMQVVERIKNEIGEVPFPMESIVPSLLMLNVTPQTEINYKDKSSPVAGGQSPLIPEKAEVSVVLSSSIVKAIVTHIAKESFIKTRSGEIKVKSISYKLLDKELQLIISSEVKENGVKTANLLSTLNFHHKAVITNGYMSDSINLLSSEHNIDPPDNEVAKELGKQMVEKMVTQANDDMRHFNMPVGPEADVLNGVPVKVVPQTVPLSSAPQPTP
ncbi:vomeromodulin-like [Dromiciops gliroides]|uniref:vomeromodulin-like n=1 Tax=Dromiciops gliroides TaxID=33562 RepID=UPI001CC5DD34|nr:vomeromodulin-like [Dromiciops gliroides]